MIPYTYEIIKVDAAARAMEVVYSSPGRQTMHIGARMPFVGESLDAVVAMYAPVRLWEEQETEVADVAEGLTGSSNPPEPDMSLSAVKQRKLAELATSRWIYETSGVLIGGVRIKTDRESQATVNAAYITLRDGLATVIDWKADGGQWVQLTLAEITPIAQAVVNHVQNSFTMERQLVEQVTAATTVERVQAITWPQ